MAAKLPHLDRMNAERRRIAGRYLAEIHHPEVALPTVLPQCEPVWHIFSIRTPRRDALEAWLASQGIGSGKHYPIPIHRQKAYQDLNLSAGAFPIAEEISATQLSLPMFYGMTEEQITAVVAAINSENW